FLLYSAEIGIDVDRFEWPATLSRSSALAADAPAWQMVLETARALAALTENASPDAPLSSVRWSVPVGVEAEARRAFQGVRHAERRGEWESTVDRIVDDGPAINPDRTSGAQPRAIAQGSSVVPKATLPALQRMERFGSATESDVTIGGRCARLLIDATRQGCDVWVVPAWTAAPNAEAGVVGFAEAPEGRPRIWRTRAYYVCEQFAAATRANDVLLEPQSERRPDDGTTRAEHLACVATLSGDCLNVHLVNSSDRPLTYSLQWNLRGALTLDDRVGGSVTGPDANLASLPSEPVKRMDHASGSSASPAATLTGAIPAYSYVTRRLPLGK
ncbi:MAG: hypothetical protein KDA61_11215, partial [Planctomycetales bacterium]|nr:hypothetical protein [Planctomycetales bacterium]